MISRIDSPPASVQSVGKSKSTPPRSRQVLVGKLESKSATGAASVFNNSMYSSALLSLVALKSAEIAWAMGNGYERLETQNEERNEPIRRLNQRYGYVVEPGSVTVRGPIAPSVGA